MPCMRHVRQIVISTQMGLGSDQLKIFPSNWPNIVSKIHQAHRPVPSPKRTTLQSGSYSLHALNSRVFRITQITQIAYHQSIEKSRQGILSFSFSRVWTSKIILTVCFSENLESLWLGKKRTVYSLEGCRGTSPNGSWKTLLAVSAKLLNLRQGFDYYFFPFRLDLCLVENNVQGNLEKDKKKNQKNLWLMFIRIPKYLFRQFIRLSDNCEDLIFWYLFVIPRQVSIVLNLIL